MSCANDTCIQAAGTAVAESLADYEAQYAYMIQTHEKPPEVTNTLTYNQYLAYVSAKILTLRAKTKGVICETSGSCDCKKPKFFYAQYVGATDGAILPATTVCQQNIQ